MRDEYTVEIYEDTDGMLIGTVEDLPGLIASGATLDELMEAVAEAIVMVEEPAQRPASSRVKKVQLAFF